MFFVCLSVSSYRKILGTSFLFCLKKLLLGPALFHRPVWVCLFNNALPNKAVQHFFLLKTFYLQCILFHAKYFLWCSDTDPGKNAPFQFSRGPFAQVEIFPSKTDDPLPTQKDAWVTFVPPPLLDAYFFRMSKEWLSIPLRMECSFL